MNDPTNCLSGFDHFVGLALKGLTLILGFREHVKDKKNQFVSEREGAERIALIL